MDVSIDSLGVAYNYSYVFEFEKNWDEPAFLDYLQRRWTDTLIYSAVYLVIIFTIKRYMTDRKEYDLRQYLAAWSASLALFSFIGTVRAIPEFLSSIHNFSFHYSVCMPTWFNSGVTGFWGSMFVISKVIELGDTVFIVLRKKPLVLLHWYHHVTVLIYCSYSFSEHTAAGRWFMNMNYVVHTVMYSYYALRAMQIYVPKQVNVMITVMQLCQMIMGCVINIMVYIYKSRGDYCEQTYPNLQLSMVMYFTYFVLFARFFYYTYIVKSKKPHKND